jgi:hypothetical protein
MSVKNSKDTIGNLTRDLLACSAVPQSTGPLPQNYNSTWGSPECHWINTSCKCFAAFLDRSTDGSRCSALLTIVPADEGCAKCGTRSQEAHLICNAAHKIISETRKWNIWNSTNDSIARFLSKLLFRITLYHWQYNTLFITKCKWELHLITKVIIALLDFVAYRLRSRTVKWRLNVSTWKQTRCLEEIPS